MPIRFGIISYVWTRTILSLTLIFTQINFLSVKPYYFSEWGPWTKDTNIFWVLVSRNAESQGPVQNYWIKICILIRSPRDLYVHYSVRCQGPWPWEMKAKALCPGSTASCCLEVSSPLGFTGLQFFSVMRLRDLTKWLSKVSFTTMVLGIKALPNTWNHCAKTPPSFFSKCITSQGGLKDFHRINF